MLLLLWGVFVELIVTSFRYHRDRIWCSLLDFHIRIKQTQCVIIVQASKAGQMSLVDKSGWFWTLFDWDGFLVFWRGAGSFSTSISSSRSYGLLGAVVEQGFMVGSKILASLAEDSKWVLVEVRGLKGAQVGSRPLYWKEVGFKL